MTRGIRLGLVLGLIMFAALAMDRNAVASRAPQQTGPVDTMVDVGTHSLHFARWRGDPAVTVVFEAGGGADASSWQSVPQRLSRRTRASIVTYDRAGLGESQLGPTTIDPVDEIEHLHRALSHLGASGAVVLVGHSYAGLLIPLYAAMFPEQVVGIVLVDPMNPAFVETIGIDRLQRQVPDIPSPTTNREHVTRRMKRTFPGLVARARAEWPPPHPAVVITAGKPWWGEPAMDEAWRQSHEALVSGASHRRMIVAETSGHDIPGTEPDLIVEAVLELVDRHRESR